MVRQGVAAAAFLAAVTTSTAAGAWTPPLLPGIAARAGGAQLDVRCLDAAEWSAADLSRGQVAALRQGRVLVADHACSVIVGYANALPRVPGPGTPQELEVSRSLYRFLAAAVSPLAPGASARRLPHAGDVRAGVRDARGVEAVSPRAATAAPRRPETPAHRHRSPEGLLGEASAGRISPELSRWLSTPSRSAGVFLAKTWAGWPGAAARSRPIPAPYPAATSRGYHSPGTGRPGE